MTTYDAEHGTRGDLGDSAVSLIASRGSLWRSRSACLRLCVRSAAGRTCTISRSTCRCGSRRFFADGRSARPLVAGTVARGQLHDDELLYTGQGRTAQDATLFPCAVDATRDGARARSASTSTARRATAAPATATAWSCSAATGVRRRCTSDRLRDAPVGHFFDVITNGFGAMPDYAAQITAEDRWAIAAYIRALQLSQHATLADVPPAERSRSSSDAADSQTADVAIPELAGLQRRLLIAGAVGAAVSLRRRVRRTRRSSSSRT